MTLPSSPIKRCLRCHICGEVFALHTESGDDLWDDSTVTDIEHGEAVALVLSGHEMEGTCDACFALWAKHDCIQVPYL